MNWQKREGHRISAKDIGNSNLDIDDLDEVSGGAGDIGSQARYCRGELVFVSGMYRNGCHGFEDMVFKVYAVRRQGDAVVNCTAIRTALILSGLLPHLANNSIYIHQNDIWVLN